MTAEATARPTYPGLEREVCAVCASEVWSLPGRSRMAAHLGRAHPSGTCQRCGRDGWHALTADELCLACAADLAGEL